MQINPEQLNPSKKRLWLIIGCSFFIILLTFFLIIRFSDCNNKIVNSGLSEENKDINPCLNGQTDVSCSRRAIDGVYVKSGEENFYPLAVVIENQIDARPQAGLAQANLVYEVEAEGGITRFLAVFASQSDIAKIGPVRSARPYLVDWAEELSALLVHCGGSPEALVKITQDDINDFDEFYHGGYFWRDISRPAPHNIYTSSANLTKYLQDNKFTPLNKAVDPVRNKFLNGASDTDLTGLTQGSFLSWKFKDDLALDLRSASSTIKIAYRAPDYSVEWRYNKKNNDYTRYLAGEVHRNESRQVIKAKNIIIEYVNAEVIDNELRLKMDNLGTGKAVVCLDGECQDGRWEKPTSTSRTRFYNRAGVEFEFNAGKTWVEVVRPEIEVKF